MIPSSVNVAGVKYSVEETSQIIIGDRVGCVGACDYHNTNIEILETLSESRKHDVFVHELTHAVLCEAGYDEQDEEMVNRVGKVFHQVLKDNDFGFLKS